MTSDSCELKGKLMLKGFSCTVYMFIKIMTSRIVLSTPVENLANSPNPVESGLVFEMFRSGSGQIYSNPVQLPVRLRAELNPLSSRTLSELLQLNVTTNKSLRRHRHPISFVFVCLIASAQWLLKQIIRFNS